MPSIASGADEPVAERRRRAALAGHVGDLEGARAGLADPAPSVRATALGALARLGRLDDATLDLATRDAAGEVRRRAAELRSGRGAAGVPALEAALADPDAAVVEAACFALGELGAAGAPGVERLATTAGAHADPLCREAAVAALGAIGDSAGLPAILAATGDKPAVRRRAVLALAPFDGPAVDEALRRALDDRDWQVRQAAEDLLAT
ncbi:MAG: HEAT repeat domain-containing protein [Acidimicrobiales bacterium]